MIHSMTAFASRSGAEGATGWQWDIRGVNARGLDLRLRLADEVSLLEPQLRKALAAALARGNVSVTLKLWHEDGAETGLQLDHAQLDRVLQALNTVQDRAFALGVTLGQPTAADVLGQRGVLAAGVKDDLDPDHLVRLLTDDFTALLAEFTAMRASEGAALGSVIAGQIAEIADLTARASACAAERAPKAAAALQEALSQLSTAASDIPPERLAQELALLAVKSDVTEEIDRLHAHVAAAKALLAQDGPVGRKLDFLAQEFNREANTLCAKAQDPALTALGLDLKAVIDRMREQVQNVE